MNLCFKIISGIEFLLFRFFSNSIVSVILFLDPECTDSIEVIGSEAEDFGLNGMYDLLLENDQVVYRRSQPVWKHQEKNFVLFLAWNSNWHISYKTDFDKDNMQALAFATMNKKEPCPYNPDYSWRLKKSGSWAGVSQSQFQLLEVIADTTTSTTTTVSSIVNNERKSKITFQNLLISKTSRHN